MPRENKGPRLDRRKKTGNWEIIWFERGQRKRCSTGTTCSQLAQEKLAEFILSEPEAEKQCSPHERRIADVLTRYLLDHASNTAKPENAILFSENLSRFWASSTVSAISTRNCKLYEQQRTKEYEQYQQKRFGKVRRKISANTVRRELETLRAALNLDKKEGRLTEVPYIWMPKKPPARQRWLSHKEAAKLLQAAKTLERSKEYLPLYILMSLYTAARKEAVLTRRWTDIDFTRNIIDFGEGNKVKRRTKVPIPSRLRRELLAARQRGYPMGYVIHNNQSPIGDIKKSFSTACDKAGLKGVTPHILRHTAISWMVQKGIVATKVAHWAGTTTGMIERVYGHLSPEHMKEIQEAWG